MMVKNAGEDKIDKTTEKPDKGRTGPKQWNIYWKGMGMFYILCIIYIYVLLCYVVK